MIPWLLFGGAPLLAALWIAAAGISGPEDDRLSRIGTATMQGGIALMLFYGVAGVLFIGWMILWTMAG